MGFEILKRYVLEIVIMIIVILIAMTAITGINPFSVFYKLDEIFDPSQINIAGSNYAQGADKYLRIECRQNAYTVTLDSAKFYYKGQPSSSTDAVMFLIIMDYKDPSGGRLFVGRDSDGKEKIITCKASETLKEFECPQDLKVMFDISNIGALNDRESFHFTIWRARSETDNMISSAASNTRFNELLNSYSSYYMSSFDIAKDVTAACKATDCAKHASEGECTSTPDCYWGPWYLEAKGCRLCPIYESCEKYEKDECIQCSQARRRNCQVVLNRCVE